MSKTVDWFVIWLAKMIFPYPFTGIISWFHRSRDKLTTMAILCGYTFSVGTVVPVFYEHRYYLVSEKKNMNIISHAHSTQPWLLHEMHYDLTFIFWQWWHDRIILVYATNQFIQPNKGLRSQELAVPINPSDGLSALFLAFSCVCS